MKKLLLLPLIALFSMTSSAQTTDLISGYINYDSLGLTSPDTFKVWLVTYNQGTTTLSAVDSMKGTGWGHVFYMFTGMGAGNYLVKAARINQTVGTSGLIPTYHDSSLYWSTAQTIVHVTTAPNTAHIWMRSGIAPSGPGFIGGNVSLGANKGASGGVPNMLILLRDASNKAIASTYTNANGDFSFSNLALGTYSVYPEAMNYATTPKANVSLTSTSTSDANSLFNQDVTQHNIKPRNLGVINTKSLKNILTVYPNPSSKSINVSWVGADGKGAHILVSNTAGQIVIDEAVTNATTTNKTINVSALTPGLYYLSGTAGLHGTAQKLTVE